MVVTQFSIGCSKTINLGNYQSIRIEATITCAVAEGETIADIKSKAQDELKSLLESTYRAQYKNADHDPNI